MAATKIGIVYAGGSGIVRRWIVPDDDNALSDGTHQLAPGEKLVLADRTRIRSPVDINAVVREAVGFEPPSARCVAVDDVTGLVVGALMADPALDKVPGHTLILDEFADVGWSLIYGVLTPPKQPLP